MIPVAEALRRIADSFTPLPAETVAISEAAGRVLARPLEARLTQPPADLSAMDGYAIRHADVPAVPTTLKVVGTAPAGAAYGKPLKPGEAVRIFTGGPVPEGADTIVIQENTTAEGDRVTVVEPPQAGRHIRRAGLDFQRGAVALPAGHRLSARDLALAAAMNHPWMGVHRRPRVAVLSTGSELVLPGEPMAENQIVASSGFAVAALVSSWGGAATHLGIARDDRDELAGCLAAAAGHDLLVTLGGASVGDLDLVQEVLVREGFELDFWKIAMRPGKPLMFGRTREGMAVLGLPGNPVSALVCALLFLRPAVLRLSGVAEVVLPTVRAALGRDLPANDTRQDYLRAELAWDGAGQPVATPFATQDSSMVSTLARAGCLIVRPPHAPAAKAGDPVEIIPLTDFSSGF